MSLARLARALAEAQTRHPWRFVLVVVAVTCVAGVAASRLEFDSRYEALLPESSPELEESERVRAETGGTRQVVLAIGGADPQARLEFGRRLAPLLREIEEIRYVDLEFPVDFFEDRAPWLMSLETLDALIPRLREAVRIAKWQANPLHLHLDEEAERRELEQAWERVDEAIGERAAEIPDEGVMTSREGRYTFVLLIPAVKTIDLEGGRAMFEKIDRAVASLAPAAQGIEVRAAGTMSVFQEQNAVLRVDLRNASLLALALGVLVVAAFTRRPLAPLLIGVVLICGVAWTFALALIMVGQLNIITGFLVAVLFGLGIDFGIHLFVRFEQELRRGKRSRAEACVAAVTGTLPPAVTSALTTAGVFFTFIAAEFRGFSEFGLIAGVGVVMTLASAFLVLPPLLVLCGRALRARDDRGQRMGAPARGAIATPVAAAVVVGLVSLAVYGAVFARDIRFHNDLRLLRGESPATRFFDYVSANLGAGLNPAVFLVDEVEHAARIAELARQRMDAHAAGGERSLIGKALAISDLLPAGVEEHRPRVEELRRFLADPKLDRAEERGGERAAQLSQARRASRSEPWTIADVPDTYRRRLTTLDGERYAVYVWPRERREADTWLLRWEDELRQLSRQLEREGIAHELADETLVLAWINRLIVADGPPLLIAAFVVMLAFLALDFRNPKQVALVALPLVVGLLCLVAVMALWQLELNLFNLVVLPSIIGIGVDNAIHIYHRYRREGRGSVMLVIRLTGAAALLASLTTAVGFGSSMIAHSPGLRSLGSLAVIGITATFASAVLFFPSALSLLERRVKGG